jgi:hypothetical protein
MAVKIWFFMIGFLLLPLNGFCDEAASSRIEQKTLTNVDKTDQIGLGVQVGSLSGVGVEYWLTNEQTINAAIVGERQNVGLSASYSWKFRNVFSGEFSRFVPFVGAGVIGANGTHTDVFKRADNENFALAAQIPVGIEYLPRLYRFGVFAEIAPSLQIAPTAYAFITGDLGARYYF